ncbi:MAG: hypothetical protein GY710_27290 [Desulfobacteraceae bacterium]|nr:hypothetical protein [Desulfobacteraceae bacterium]
MDKSPRLILLMAALMIGLCLHTSSVWAKDDSPTQVVKDFTKAYYMLEPSMANFLSQDAKTNENGVDMVDLYLRLKNREAYNRGYKLSYLQMKPILMKTKVLDLEDSSAQVQIEVTTIRSINPLYRIVGFVFSLLKEHKVQDTITLVKEDGLWKIGPGAFNLPS